MKNIYTCLYIYIYMYIAMHYYHDIIKNSTTKQITDSLTHSHTALLLLCSRDSLLFLTYQFIYNSIYMNASIYNSIYMNDY
ncbi:hypothetical protein BDF14DRAFT_1838118 [Spinellus fusiger]|nr:hypothetical protein BDF14DRAFT_1838118 [Spinellus fusiger]